MKYLIMWSLIENRLNIYKTSVNVINGNLVDKPSLYMTYCSDGFRLVGDDNLLFDLSNDEDAQTSDFLYKDINDSHGIYYNGSVYYNFAKENNLVKSLLLLFDKHNLALSNFDLESLNKCFPGFKNSYFAFNDVNHLRCCNLI